MRWKGGGGEGGGGGGSSGVGEGRCASLTPIPILVRSGV